MKREKKYLVPAWKKTKRSSHRLQPEQVKQMIADYLNGEPAYSVGKRFNCSLDNVRYHVKKLGLWPGGKRIEPIEKRFWRKVKKSDVDGECWLWQGSFFPNGYGCFSLKSESIGAHRMAYELSKGPIPLTLTIDHLCFNKACVNPEHLEVVTAKENYQRWYKLHKAKQSSISQNRQHP